MHTTKGKTMTRNLFAELAAAAVMTMTAHAGKNVEPAQSPLGGVLARRERRHGIIPDKGE